MSVVLKQSTEIKVRIGPFVDATDGVSPEVGILLSTADEAEVLKANGVATVSISAATWAAVTGSPGWYDLTMTTSLTDTIGELCVVVQDASVSLPVFQKFQVVEEAVYASFYAASGTLGTAQTGDNFARLAAPAGASVSADIAAIKAETALVVADTNELQTVLSAGILARSNNATLETLLGVDDDAAADTVVFQVWEEILTGATHNVNNSSGKRLRQAAGFVLHAGTAQAGAASTITLDTGASTLDNFYNHAKVIITDNTGSEQERLVSDYVGSTRVATITPAWSTNPDATSEFEIVPGIAHCETSKLGYSGGAVWYDDVGGAAGARLYVNGTEENPCSSWADVQTIQTALGLRIAHALPGSTVTLDSSYENRELIGAQYSLDLSGESIDNSQFSGAAHVNGIGLAASNPPFFILCGIETVTLDPSNGFQCSFAGTFTMGTAGTFIWGGSGSLLPNATAVVFDFGAALNASNFSIENWTGGAAEIKNAGTGTGTYHFDMTGHGDLIVNVNCSATTVVTLHGSIGLTDNASGITYADEANYNETQADTLNDTALSNIGLDHLVSAAVVGADVTDDSIIAQMVSKSATADWDDFVNTTESLQALKDTLPLDILTTALADVYAANTVAPTLQQAVMAIHQALMAFAISSTSISVKKIDGTTEAFVNTIDSASVPTQSIRS